MNLWAAWRNTWQKSPTAVASGRAGATRPPCANALQASNRMPSRSYALPQYASGLRRPPPASSGAFLSAVLRDQASPPPDGEGWTSRVGYRDTIGSREPITWPPRRTGPTRSAGFPNRDSSTNRVMLPTTSERWKRAVESTSVVSCSSFVYHLLSSPLSASLVRAENVDASRDSVLEITATVSRPQQILPVMSVCNCFKRVQNTTLWQQHKFCSLTLLHTFLPVGIWLETESWFLVG